MPGFPAVVTLPAQSCCGLILPTCSPRSNRQTQPASMEFAHPLPDIVFQGPRLPDLSTGHPSLKGTRPARSLSLLPTPYPSRLPRPLRIPFAGPPQPWGHSGLAPSSLGGFSARPWAPACSWTPTLAPSLQLQGVPSEFWAGAGGLSILYPLQAPLLPPSAAGTGFLLSPGLAKPRPAQGPSPGPLRLWFCLVSVRLLPTSLPRGGLAILASPASPTLPGPLPAESHPHRTLHF
eukprot:XP_028355391.1 BCL-6 corepressor-like protein 1 [Physeter catodon]